MKRSARLFALALAMLPTLPAMAPDKVIKIG